MPGPGNGPRWTFYPFSDRHILGNADDITTTEHATGTHAVTLVSFGLFDLLGHQLPPRICDLGKIIPCRTGP
ncbi:Tn3 family transposase [Amycolatopsis sp. cmx-4-68]|uniref:Tn3 family transposase n=1 Tax=Amycolatopsis sp. cmx-4-68 TaxID=2790938 RepID=UPI00397E451A